MMKKYYLILPLVILFLTGCKQEALLKGLEQSQANEVIALLQRNNIPAIKKEVAKEGFVVSVNPRDFVASVDLMTTYGLPRQPNMEIAQMFPADSLVSSPRAEKARLYSGIEQRLAQSLLSIQGVITARVHVSYDLDASEGDRKKKAVHLSSLLNYDNSVVDTVLLIGDVKRFLKNSFDDVDYDNISVVLSKVSEVQRIPPSSIPESSPSAISWLLIVGALTLSLILFFLLFIKKSNHSLATKIKQSKVFNNVSGQRGFSKHFAQETPSQNEPEQVKDKELKIRESSDTNGVDNAR